jgi:hypothetical protein
MGNRISQNRAELFVKPTVGGLGNENKPSVLARRDYATGKSDPPPCVADAPVVRLPVSGVLHRSAGQGIGGA